MPGYYAGGKKKVKTASALKKQKPKTLKVRTGNFKISKIQAASGGRS